MPDPEIILVAPAPIIGPVLSLHLLLIRGHALAIAPIELAFAKQEELTAEYRPMFQRLRRARIQMTAITIAISSSRMTMRNAQFSPTLVV